MYHSLFIYLLTKGHCDYFQVLAFMNRDNITFVCRFLCEYVFNSFQLILRGMTVGLYGNSMFNFGRNSQSTPKVAVLFCIFTSKEWEFLMLHIPTSTGVSNVPDFVYYNTCRYSNTGRSHCCFNLYFTDSICCGYAYLPSVYMLE